MKQTVTMGSKTYALKSKRKNLNITVLSETLRNPYTC